MTTNMLLSQFLNKIITKNPPFLDGILKTQEISSEKPLQLVKAVGNLPLSIPSFDSKPFPAVGYDPVSTLRNIWS